MKLEAYSAAGEKKGTKAVSDALFAGKVNEDLMHRAVTFRLHNRRNPIAHTLTRGEVAKTTAKFFRQKGTGRARRGAVSTNLLRGGGVAHGPRNTRVFQRNMPKKERRAALLSALSVRGKSGDAIWLEMPEMKMPRTKDFLQILAKLPAAKKYLFVLGEKNENFEKSARNVPKIQILRAEFLNPLDILHAEKIVFVGDGIEKAEKIFSPPAK